MQVPVLRQVNSCTRLNMNEPSTFSRKWYTHSTALEPSLLRLELVGSLEDCNGTLNSVNGLRVLDVSGVIICLLQFYRLQCSLGCCLHDLLH